MWHRGGRGNALGERRGIVEGREMRWGGGNQRGSEDMEGRWGIIEGRG